MTTERQDFAGRHVVVTGGAGALGVAVIGKLLDRGATCHVPIYPPTALDHFPYRNHERVRMRAGTDMTVESVVEGFYADIPSLWASLHLAGGFRMAPLAETSLSDFLKLMNMNAVTCFLCSREALKAIRRGEQPGGRMVNVSARPVLVPTAGMSAYTASKAVVSALTTSLAEELAPEGIWVNEVVPSLIDSPANREAMPDADFDSWPKAEDIATVILDLASPENKVTRGARVTVYGKV